ncbi:polysaccharide biosynthesis tyrosine autokinase [Litorilinea aerophila]|uniref:non-specific protein-tyrosine kinase n=1 Tax=Litorilinea aerophila TaxID=1204385 RepID=A0A540VFH4_9CHLR|nr:tyrosine-protein kinase family protein [Litorilinea aerophila]MCC9076808.1 polysaccharide biosynthesis tyrosine autokinase [Litorilinea aerophila]
MDTLDLREYIRPLLRWWWLILLAALAAGTASFLYLRQQPPTYEARTTIMVGTGLQDPNPNNSQLGLSQTLAQTYADMARRAPLREATMAALQLSKLPEYTVSVAPDSQVIEITVIDQDPQLAYVVANELVRQLIRQSPAGREEQDRENFINQQLDQIEAGIEETEAEIDRKREELAGLFSARDIANTEAQIAALQTKLSTLRANYASLLANSQRGAVNKITILEPASLPTRPLPSNILLNVLAAAMVGAVLAASGAYVLELLDDSVRDEEDVRRRLQLPLIAAVPTARGPDPLVMAKGLPSAATEAYRGLRTNLQFCNVDQELQVLLLTSPAPQEGKSVTTANLALALAHLGQRVILVDADLHRPVQHRLFKLPNKVGLTNGLLAVSAGGQVEVERLLQPTGVPTLRLLTSGPLPPNPAELLGSRRMKELLAQLRQEADVILLDSPPATVVVDATILATLADGVLVVLRAGRTRRARAQRALESLQNVHARIIGAVLNGASVKASYYSHPEYGYGINPQAATSGGGGSLLSRLRRNQPASDDAPGLVQPGPGLPSQPRPGNTK